MPDESLPLVPLAGSQLARQGSGGGRILDDMVSSTLTTSQKEGALIPRYRIGDIDFCEPDYRQMLLWAEEMVMTPEAVLLALWNEEALFQFLGPSYDSFNNTHIWDGRLKRVIWDFKKLPLRFYEWIQGLEIESLEYRGYVPMGIIAPVLPSLTSLRCDGCDAFDLDLKNVPALEKLSCSFNPLIFWDLHCVSGLEELACEGCGISELDLSAVPYLTSLNCRVNSLETLVLNAVDGLQSLDCGSNNLAELLHLEFLPELRFLNCSVNMLNELSLAGCEMLEELDCSENLLSKLDLSFNPEIKRLSCEGNWLEELDIRPLQHLESLTYDRDRTRLIQRPDQNF